MGVSGTAGQHGNMWHAQGFEPDQTYRADCISIIAVQLNVIINLNKWLGRRTGMSLVSMGIMLGLAWKILSAASKIFTTYLRCSSFWSLNRSDAQDKPDE
jgi:hypothetical protein